MSLLSEYSRRLTLDIPLNPVKGSGAAFLWGPRGTGKTTFLKQRFPHAKFYDLLESNLFTDLTLHPSLLREEVLAKKPQTIVIDEIQKVPALLDEVHWLLENTASHIILCGSSARKLKRETKNLLGGRAAVYQLCPLVTAEIPDFQLARAIQFGTLPRHYLSDKARTFLKAYVSTYLKEEIIEEAIVRNIPSFEQFLLTVALTHGQLLNFANVAREVGVSPSTVRDYYQILTDTLVGHRLEPWKKAKDRRLIETAKFYLFDVGVANYLHPEVKQVVEGTDIYGNAFEHLLIEEIRAYLAYNDKDLPISFWRTASGYEVDLIVGTMEVAIEFKSTARIAAQHFKGLRALKTEHRVRRALVISRDPMHRRTEDQIELLHWKEFCRRLWAGEIV